MSQADQAITTPFDDATTSRRSVLGAGATGIAIALAAPFSAGATSASPAGDDADWPEFQQWLKDAIALDDHYARSGEIHDAHEAGSPPWDPANREAYFNREEYQDDEQSRLCDVASAMAARPVRTERQLAMLVALAVWAFEKTGTRGGYMQSFRLADILAPDNDIQEAICARLVHALARQAKQVMPELPFIFSAEA